MIIRKPKYFDSFRCIAAACPDSCCKEWAVQVDEESAKKYRSLPGSLGERFREVMMQEDGDWILALTPDGRCPMWRQDGLCRVQGELGEEALCKTCREFPRLTHDYGNFVERDLELSCPEGARILLSSEDSWVSEEIPGMGEGDYDADAMDILLQSREKALQLLREPGISLGQALSALLLYGAGVQEWLDGGEAPAWNPRKDLETAGALAAPGSMEEILDVFRELEILTPRWQQLLDDPKGGKWQPSHGAIARYLVRRYWLQAVSDYDLMGRVKLVIISCLTIRALGPDVLAIAQLYSKEIENNAENIDALLDGAYTEPAFVDIRLLGLLLEETP